MEKYDAIIIGFGKAGKTLAADLGSRGWKVAVVERSPLMYGGTCINIGCIPTKALVHAAQVAVYRRPSSFEEQTRAYRRAVEAKNELIAALRRKNYDKLDAESTVTIYTGEASFVSPYEIEVKMPGETLRLESPKIFINTGAATVMPPIDGIEGNPYVYTSTTLMELEKLPRRLVIVGGGYIGLEFASMYAGFGSEVIVLESGDRFIPREDRDIAEAVKKVLEKKGIAIRLNARVESIGQEEGRAVVQLHAAQGGETETIEAEAVLLATGRRPDTEGLNLAAAGVKTTERGAIEVDARLHTNVPHIWAMGDVRGGLQFTYLSLDDYRVIRDELFGSGNRRADDRQAVPYAVFIDPPLANVGLTEEAARQAGRQVKVSSVDVSTLPRARTIGQPEGLLKAVVDAETGRILGCSLFCAEASEVINTVSLAMRMGVPYTYLRDGIYTHPSMSESLNDLFGGIR